MKNKFKMIIKSSPLRLTDEGVVYWSKSNKSLKDIEYYNRDFFKYPAMMVVNQEAILRKYWDNYYPKENDVVILIRVYGGGGGGGDGGKSTLSTILSITAAAFFGVAGVLGAVGVSGVVTGILYGVGAAAGVAGLLMGFGINETEKESGLEKGSGTPSPRYSFQGQKNMARLGEPIPVIYGKMRTYPDLAESPWYEYDNWTGDQRVYQNFIIGAGQLLFKNLKVGSLSSISASDQGEIDVRVISNYGNYIPQNKNSMHEKDFNNVVFDTNLRGTTVKVYQITNKNGDIEGFQNYDLKNSKNYLDFKNQTKISNIIFNFTAPQGIYWMNKSGNVMLGQDLLHRFPTKKINELMGINFEIKVIQSGSRSNSKTLPVKFDSLGQINNLLKKNAPFLSRFEDLDTSEIEEIAKLDDDKIYGYISIKYSYKEKSYYKKYSLKHSTSDQIGELKKLKKETIPSRSTVDYLRITTLDSTVGCYKTLTTSLYEPGSHADYAPKWRTFKDWGFVTDSDSEEWLRKQIDQHKLIRDKCLGNFQETRKYLQTFYANTLRFSFNFKNDLNWDVNKNDKIRVEFKHLDYQDPRFQNETTFMKDLRVDSIAIVGDHIDYYPDVTYLNTVLITPEDTPKPQIDKVSVEVWSKNNGEEKIKDVVHDILTNNVYGLKEDTSRTEHLISNENTSKFNEQINCVIDKKMPTWDLLKRICNAHYYTPVTSSNRLHLIKNEKVVSLPTALYSERNMIDWKISYTLYNDKTIDHVEVKYIDQDKGYIPQILYAYFKLDNGEPSYNIEVYYKPDNKFSSKPTHLKNPFKIDGLGITNRAMIEERAKRILKEIIYSNKKITITTDMEGLVSQIGDLILVSIDQQKWGQSNKISTIIETPIHTKPVGIFGEEYLIVTKDPISSFKQGDKIHKFNKVRFKNYGGNASPIFDIKVVSDTGFKILNSQTSTKILDFEVSIEEEFKTFNISFEGTNRRAMPIMLAYEGKIESPTCVFSYVDKTKPKTEPQKFLVTSVKPSGENKVTIEATEYNENIY